MICTENLHPLDLDIDGTDPLDKTLNCFNPVFRLPFLGIYAEWWDIGALLLRWKVGILESWNFRIFQFLNFLILEFWHFGKLEFSNF